MLCLALSLTVKLAQPLMSVKLVTQDSRFLIMSAHSLARLITARLAVEPTSVRLVLKDSR